MSLLQTDHYSYSTLSGFSECPYMIYLQKIEKIPLISNGFAEQGTLIHNLLDEWAKGKISADKLPEEYEKRYSQYVVTQFPRMLSSKGYTEKTYQQGLEYFKNFDRFEGFEIVSAEEACETTIAGRPFVGFIDLILREKETGNIVICDHKSKSLSSFKKAENEMYKQQLLYAKFVYEKYNVWPDTLMFNLFKENVRMTRPFSQTEYQDTLHWAEEQIRKIESFDTLDWLETKEQDFFCTEICSCRKECYNGVYVKKK